MIKLNKNITFFIALLLVSALPAWAQNNSKPPTNPFSGDAPARVDSVSRVAPAGPVMQKTLADSSEKKAIPTDSSLSKTAAIDSAFEKAENPLPMVYAHYKDSTLYCGLDYGTFKDVYAWLPGTYVADRGMMGDDSRGAMFAGIPGEFDLYYGFLSVNDPLTGLADLYNIPVQGIGAMENLVSHGSGWLSHSIAGQTLAVSSLDIANFTPRSIVSYRTGQTDFDDIDVRVGLYTSEKMKINAGGLLKHYLGQVDRNHYNGQKLNLQVQRELSDNWELEYLYLQNKTELDVPVLQNASLYDLNKPHQSIKRVDQGLALHYKSLWSLTAQHTNYRRDYHDNLADTSVYNQTQKARDIRVTSQARKKIAGLYWDLGGEYLRQKLQSPAWEDTSLTRYQGWFMTSLNREAFSVNAGIRQVVLDEFDKSYTLPEISMVWRPTGQLAGFAWANRSVRRPSFEALFSTGPFYHGNRNLKPATYNQTGAGVEFTWHGLQAYISGSAMNIKDQAALWATLDTTLFINQAEHTRYALDWAVDLAWKYGLSGTVKGKYTYISSDNEYFDITNYPSVYARGYIQYHNIFFEGDLDLTVRLGGAFIGESYTPEYYYAQYPLSEWITDPIVVPFVLIMPKVKDMTLFFSFQNLTNVSYQQVFAYPMPKYEFKWGFTWQFFD